MSAALPRSSVTTGCPPRCRGRAPPRAVGPMSALPRSRATAYDLFTWIGDGKPVVVHTTARETHGAGATAFQESYTYSGGRGATVGIEAGAPAMDLPAPRHHRGGRSCPRKRAPSHIAQFSTRHSPQEQRLQSSDDDRYHRI